MINNSKNTSSGRKPVDNAPKIIPRIFGGMGNQLFCYAAARRLALVNNGELVIDSISGFVKDHDYKRHYQLDHFNIRCRKATAIERLEPLSRIRRYLKRSWNNQFPFEKKNYIQQEGINFDERLLKHIPRGNVYLEGYWQSEGYFEDVENVIRQDLQINPPNDVKNKEIAANILGCQSVAVHVRFFDLPSETSKHNAPNEYYSRAVKRMETLLSDAHYFIFSDQPDAARNCIPLPDDRITCVSHNCGDDVAHIDLWLMAQCQNFIIANSTFSWWGAWLSSHQEKIVMSPNIKIKGVTSWGFDGLIPEKWLEI